MRALILAIGLAALIGCKGVEPLGPFANKAGGGKKKAPRDEGPPPPVTVPAPKPTPPVNLIYPDEVSPENPQASIQKLRNELEADSKSIPAPPMTAEVSRIKGRVR